MTIFEGLHTHRRLFTREEDAVVDSNAMDVVKLLSKFSKDLSKISNLILKRWRCSLFAGKDVFLSRIAREFVILLARVATGFSIEVGNRFLCRPIPFISKGE